MPIVKNVRSGITDIMLERKKGKSYESNKGRKSIVQVFKYDKQHISLRNVESEVDLKCKVLECCSRDAVKSMPYPTNKGNKLYQDDVRENINIFLNTDFTREDMELVYQRLGNGIRHELTIKFVQSNYDFEVLRSEEE
ncbi:hypothetical protein [Amedibacterium intestinale]|uniref:hypothetical protein n=1 Tax=Amedibacterium intestinale TaxID=2583452 RepID=UPI001300B851